MDLGAFLTILLARKWLILWTTAVTVVAAGVVVFLLPPTYEASATLRVRTTPSQSVIGRDDLLYADRLMNTYLKLATSKPVLRGLAQRLYPGDASRRAGESPDKLTEKFSVTTLANTELIRISFEDADPVGAAKGANSLATSLIAYIRSSTPSGNLRVPIPTIVERAALPTSPSKPRKTLVLGLAVVVGLIGGIAFALVNENLHKRLYEPEEIADAARTPVLGEIPAARRHNQTGIFNSNSPQHEAFRRLGISIAAEEHKAFLITSSARTEGKSTVAANLASAAASRGLNVVLVDADFRLPTLHDVFGVSNEFGLSTRLERQGRWWDLDALLQRPSDGLHLLTSGPLPRNPSELLSSAEMSSLMRRLRDKFDLILIDTPAFLSVADTVAITPLIDSVVLVVSRGREVREVEATRDQLAKLKVPVAGIVVNRSRERYHDTHYAVARRGRHVVN
jgi:succinoglycan biosynthesis transport protein ExoP